MASVEASTCPSCGAPPGALRLEFKLVVAAVGDFSLAGVMTKFPARERPVLTCSACPLHLVGEFDGRHVTFTPAPVPQ